MQSHSRIRHFLLLLGVISISSACSRTEIDTSQIVRPVRVMEIASKDAVAFTTYPAEVQARYEATLSFQVGGRLIERNAEVGQRVRAGEVLARVDPKDLDLALRAAQAQYQVANTEYEQAAIDLKRAKSLRAQEVISQAEMDKQQVYFEATASQLAQAKANLSAQRNQSQYSALTSPRDGIVTKVFAEVGQVLGPGQPVLHWADPKAVQVKFSVPESRISQYPVGRKASVSVWSDSERFEATIREVAPVADPLTRAYPVYLDIPNPPEKIRFGMSATVFFDHALGADRIQVPVSAVVADGLGAFVWVFDEAAGVVNRRDIEASEVSGEGVLIEKGLKAGDLVVTAGTHVLTEGIKVKRFIETGDIDRAIEEKRAARKAGE